MKIHIFPDGEAVAVAAAEFIASEARAAVESRGRFIMALSGGRTPWQMLGHLAEQQVPWARVEVVQVDERIAPAGDADRNLTHLHESLAHAPLRQGQIHAMPVEEKDMDSAVRSYAKMLSQIAGTPPVLDLVQLGLGADGHTASLIPHDAVLDVTETDVSLTGKYQERRRMTLSYPMLNRARRIVWVIVGGEKAGMVARLFEGDVTVPAGRIRRDRAIVFADKSAAGELPSSERREKCEWESRQITAGSN
ncbi:MAG: 6-phosphogluconolactonase [Verrucomicrobiota bacterium]